MADYYHTARAAKRQIEETQKQNKRRRELAGDTGQPQIEHPLNALSIEGRPLKVHKTSMDHHAAINRMDGLIPWNGDHDNLIDRFDVRCMLDFYREPASAATNEHKAVGDAKLLQLLQFESFRDLVKFASKGLQEEAGIEAAQEESLVIRAQARVEATAAFRAQSHQPQLPGDTGTTTGGGAGPYSAVGFSYGGATAAAADDDGDDSSSSSDSDSDSEGAEDQETLAEEDAEDAIDDVAESYGITNFSWRLHKAQTQEGEEDAKRRQPRKRSNRKRARERSRRMAGMGLDTSGKTLLNWHDPLVTQAPSAHLVRPRRPSPEGRSRSRSPPSRHDRHDPLGSLRSLPTLPKHTIDRKAFERDDNDIIDALPDQPDPAMSGPQPFPANFALENIRKQQEVHRRDRRRSYSPRDRSYRRRSSRSRSRDRSRRRSRSRSPSRHSRYSHHRRHSMSRSRSRSRSPRPSSRRREGGSGSGSGAAPPAAAAQQGAKAAAPETPAERMKRIIAAQLNKQSSTDTMKGMKMRR